MVWMRKRHIALTKSIKLKGNICSSKVMFNGTKGNVTRKTGLMPNNLLLGINENYVFVLRFYKDHSAIVDNVVVTVYSVIIYLQ